MSNLITEIEDAAALVKTIEELANDPVVQQEVNAVLADVGVVKTAIADGLAHANLLKTKLSPGLLAAVESKLPWLKASAPHPTTGASP